jgi:ribosomal protein S18 acetylase RimI-like enzyme
MDIPDIDIRPARDEDRAGVLALAPRLAIGVAPWRDQAEARAAGRRWLEDSLGAAAGKGAVLVASDNSKRREDGGGDDGDGAAAEILGVISVRPARHFTGERDGYIGELVVAENASRRGIGRALTTAAEAWAREHGLENLTLHTGIFNTEARAFYAVLGFVEEEVRLTRAVPPGRLP